MASQSSGFTFENSIRESVFDLPFDPNNTDKYDIPAEKNRFDPNENISIKSSGNGNIDCGDIIRFYNYDFSKSNTIIVVSYEQEEEYKVIKAIYEINYNRDMHSWLFGSITQDDLKEYVESIKNIPKGISGEEARKTYNYLSVKEALQKEHHMKINISPKVDSKGQRRVQCSIPSFLKNITPFIKYKSPYDNKNLIRERIIPIKIQSSKRKRGETTKDTLLKICKENNLKGYSNKKKQCIIELLTNLNLYSKSG